MRQPSRAIIVTSCTNRKKNTGELLHLGNDNDVATAHELAKRWNDLLLGAQHRIPAIDLYQGRSFTEARLAAKTANAQLFVASAGHGVVRSDQLLPAYNLTVATAPDNFFLQSLTRLGASSADWWHALTELAIEPRSLSHLVSRLDLTGSIVLVAMPSAYLAMLSKDLARLTDRQAARLRFFTSMFGINQLPVRLRPFALPYDERLESAPSYAGTRNDFAQRALRHFVTELDGHTLPLDIAHQRVADAMRKLKGRTLPARGKKTDAELEELILKNWGHLSNSQSAALRWLRDDQLISCEQQRFRNLWHKVQEGI